MLDFLLQELVRVELPKKDGNFGIGFTVCVTIAECTSIKHNVNYHCEDFVYIIIGYCNCFLMLYKL